MKKKEFLGICALFKYKVKIHYKSDYYCYTDYEGDSVFEHDDYIETQTFEGFELVDIFSKHFKSRDFFDFEQNGKNFHFGFFEPLDGSTADIDYEILSESY